MLRVWLSGGLRVAAGERALELPASRRARGLLAWLALHPGTHARGELAGRFWPDVLEESARASLRGALAELRRALADGAEALVATRETVALSDEAWVDVREFARAQARDEPDAAVAACRGELLAGMDDDWVHEARATFRAALTDAYEALARRAERAGDAEAAVRHSRAAVALDPLAEDPARRLIGRLLAAGDRGAAVAAYEQLAERMRTELALAPSAQTRLLLAELRRPKLDVPAPAMPRGPFVGREAELRQLADAWERTLSRASRRLVLIAGEPGIGKTRLALRFAEQVRDSGATALLGHCSWEPIGAYEPFAEVLAHSADAVGEELLLASAGARSDELVRLLGHDAGVSDDPGARHRLYRAVDAALSAFAPLLLIVDDIQWADQATHTKPLIPTRHRRWPTRLPALSPCAAHHLFVRRVPSGFRFHECAA